MPSAEARSVVVVVARGAGFTLVAMRFPEQRRSCMVLGGAEV